MSQLKNMLKNPKTSQCLTILMMAMAAIAEGGKAHEVAAEALMGIAAVINPPAEAAKPAAAITAAQ